MCSYVKLFIKITISLKLFSVILTVLSFSATYLIRAAHGIPARRWSNSRYRTGHALRVPEGCLTDFKTVGTCGCLGCQPYAPAAFTSRKYFWYSFLLEAESTPGPQCGRKDYVHKKFQWHHREPNPQPSGW